MILKNLLPLLLASTLLLCGCGMSAPAPKQGPDQSQLATIRSAVNDMRAMLEEYYAGSAVLENSWYLPADHPGRDESTRFMADKFARALTWQDNFVIGTIGSSVTAAFDNCRYDCYQQQLERLFAPVLATGGVRFEVRNSGQGGECGDSYENQVWCLPMLVGDEVDITHYSWTYFEAGKKATAPAFHEMFYRWSLMMNHSPAPQLIYANDCGGLTDADKALLDLYAPFGADVLCMTRGLSGLGYERREWGEMGDPLHASSREGELPDVSELRRKSLAVMYRNWHPGPLLLQTTADALAWRYSTALLMALDWLEAEPTPTRRWPRKTSGLSLAELPAPAQCPDPWCSTENLPSCVNFETPTFGVPGVEFLDPAGSGWTFDPGQPIPQAAMPREEKNLPQCAHPNRCSGWKVPAGEQGGWLSFDLPKLELGLVTVCCSSKTCGQDMLEAKVEFLLNGHPPAREPELFSNKKCVQVQAEHAEGEAGDPVRLQLRLPPLSEPLPPVTHVFGL